MKQLHKCIIRIKFQHASAFFSCYGLNAGLEPRVCDIYAMRLPRLRPPCLTLNTASPYTLSHPLYNPPILDVRITVSVLDTTYKIDLSFC